MTWGKKETRISTEYHVFLKYIIWVYDQYYWQHKASFMITTVIFMSFDIARDLRPIYGGDYILHMNIIFAGIMTNNFFHFEEDIVSNFIFSFLLLFLSVC